MTTINKLVELYSLHGNVKSGKIILFNNLEKHNYDADEIKRLGVRVSFLDNIDCNSTSSHSTIDIPVYNQQRGRFTVNVQFLPSETIGKIINNPIN